MSGNLNKDQQGFKYVRRSLLHMKHKILFEIIEGRIMVFFRWHSNYMGLRVFFIGYGWWSPCLNSYINLNTVIWFCKKIGSRPPTNEIIEKYQSGLRKTDNGKKNTYFRTRKIVIEVIIFNNEVKFIRKKEKKLHQNGNKSGYSCVRFQFWEKETDNKNYVYHYTKYNEDRSFAGESS